VHRLALASPGEYRGGEMSYRLRIENATAAAALVVMAATLAIAGCGSAATAPGSSSSPVAQPLSPGTSRLISTTGPRIDLAGTAGTTTKKTRSRRFAIAPPGLVTYSWACSRTGADASFRAYMWAKSGTEPYTTRTGAPLMDIAKDPLSATNWTGLGFTQPLTGVVSVTARHCRWSLTILAGGSAVETYTNRGYHFAIDYDPTKLDFEKHLQPTASGIMQPGLYAALMPGPTDMNPEPPSPGHPDTGYDGLVLHAAKGKAPNDADVRTAVESRHPKGKWEGGATATTVGSLPDYMLTYAYELSAELVQDGDQSASPQTIVYPLRLQIYCFSGGGFWYQAQLQASLPTWSSSEPMLSSVLKSFRVTR
jgi:hypothetical protein